MFQFRSSLVLCALISLASSSSSTSTSTSTSLVNGSSSSSSGSSITSSSSSSIHQHQHQHQHQSPQPRRHPRHPLSRSFQSDKDGNAVNHDTIVDKDVVVETSDIRKLSVAPDAGERKSSVSFFLSFFSFLPSRKNDFFFNPWVSHFWLHFFLNFDRIDDVPSGRCGW